MASILALTDDCLFRIIQYIQEPSSFYGITLTCRRINQLTQSTRSILHSKLLLAKAQYSIKRYIIDIGDDYDRYCKLESLLRDSKRLAEAKRSLTYSKVIDAWQRNGPVVAKLFTWLRHQGTEREEGDRRATTFTERREFTLHLPDCGKDMVIKTEYFNDYGHNYDPELSIRVTCGDIDVKSEDFTRYVPDDYMYWEDEEATNAVGPLKPAINLLQKELGDTVPPITDRFFIWLCYLFPHDRLSEELCLNFKEAARNAKPSLASVQPAIEEFYKSQQIGANFQKAVSAWAEDEKKTSEVSVAIADTLCLLGLRSEAKIFGRLEGDAPRFYHAARDYDLRKLPRKLLFDLLQRTSLGVSDYTAGSVADKYVENRVSFRCFGGKVIEVCGAMHGDGASYPTWDELDLTFKMPDDGVVKLEAGQYRKKLSLGLLRPITELLQQCVDYSMRGEARIPKIGDIFSFVYFMQVLEFSGESETFAGRYDKLIPSKSEEESDCADQSSDGEP